MKEILFCGKRIDNGEWAEGFYVKFYSNGNSNPNYMIFTIDEQNRSSQPYTIAPETVCRYTGVHDGTKWEQLSKTEQDKFLSKWNLDKNRQNIKEDWCGRKVFEGNIVRTRKRRLCKVIWFSSPQYQGWNLISIETNSLYPEEWKKWKDLEVIGNVYDNVDLLKEVDE